MTAAKAAMAADPGSEAAQDLFDRARMELASEQSYLEFTRAVLNRDYAQVAELFRRLSPASVYRARAQHEHDRLKHDYIRKYDREGKDLAEQGRCQDQERLAVEAAKVWSEARRAIRLHPCKQAATRAAVAAPPPSSSEPETLPGTSPGRIAPQELNEEPATVEGSSGDGSVAAPAAAPAPAFEQLAADARRAAAEGEYTRALELCEAALEKKSDDRGAATTCGVAACRLRNAAKARQFILAVEGGELREQLKRICLLEGVDI